MPGRVQLQVEKLLAIAHQALMRGAFAAETLSDQGLSDDLYGLAREVARLQEDLLRGKKRRIA